MSLDHTKTMLQTLKKYQNSQIILTFNNKYQVPLLSVCCLDDLFKISYFESQRAETFEDIYTTMSAIEKTIKNSYLKPLAQ
jgi:hypothetical protein